MRNSLIRPIATPLAGPLQRGLTEVRGGGVWRPAPLFAGGVKGLAYDLTDKSTLHVDSARTTPVSVAGDLIGSVADLSPNGVYATQTTTGSKPRWDGTYATLDGFDDFLVTPSIDFTGTDKVTVVVGLYKASDASAAILCELSADSNANNGAFAVIAPGVPLNTDVQFRSRGSATVSVPATSPAGAGRVISGQGDISAPDNRLRVDGVQQNRSTATQGAGTYGNHILYIGRRAGTSLPFNGRIHRLLIIGRALTASELQQAERWAAQPTGVTLP